MVIKRSWYCSFVWSANYMSHRKKILSHPHSPRPVKPLKTLWINMRWSRHTRKGVEYTKLMPVQVPNRTCLMNSASDNRTSFSNSTKRLLDKYRKNFYRYTIIYQTNTLDLISTSCYLIYHLIQNSLCFEKSKPCFVWDSLC